MGWRERYERGKLVLVEDVGICAANRSVFREFFEFEEYKLKRQNGLRELDDACYKTLYGYVCKLRRVNEWFGNKPWKDLTQADIKRVYDDLEDGKILNAKGKPFEDRAGYYAKILKGKPFRIVQKSELARNVIEFSTSTRKEVAYVTEETFLKLVGVIANPVHLLLFWLAWDIGENVDALLKLSRRDFVRQRNKHTNETEYLVNLPQRIIKRSRQTRTEPTLYPQTVRYADIVLDGMAPDDAVFAFGHRQALKLIHAIAKKAGATCMPNNEPVRWKHFRAGMACHLLKSGWSREEVDARLGHTPNSQALDRYVTYLAIDREKPKKRLFDSSLEEIQSELEEAKRREKLAGDRIRRQGEDNRELKAELEDAKGELARLREEFREMVRLVRGGGPD